MNAFNPSTGSQRRRISKEEFEAVTQRNHVLKRPERQNKTEKWCPKVPFSLKTTTTKRSNKIHGNSHHVADRIEWAESYQIQTKKKPYKIKRRGKIFN